jgi:disulfide bond formation protein DsbB
MNVVSTDAATLFFAFLAVGAEAAVVLLAGLALGALASPAITDGRDQLAAIVGPKAFPLALIVATVATAGSLYLSEVAHFDPCRLCWYQRAAMYPLVPLLALATWRRWFAARWVVLAIAVLGGSVSVWHILIERYPTLESGACDPTNPCSLIWVRRFCYLTIPTMALSAFALIAALMLVVRPPTSD